MSDELVDEPAGRMRPYSTATIAVLAANAIVFILQMLVQQRYYPHLSLNDPSYPFNYYFALSLDGLKHGYLWQLLTFQFMHGGYLHIILNSWAIWVFGRVVETTIGWRKMLALYFVSGVAGGLLQMLGVWLVPSLFADAGVVGASAGGFGLIAAFGVLYPNQPLFMLLFMIIPIKMRATTLVWVSVAASVFGIITPYIVEILIRAGGFAVTMAKWLDSYTEMAHAGHLGGIIAGFLFARSLLKRRPRRQGPPPIITAPAKSALNVNPASD